MLIFKERLPFSVDAPFFIWDNADDVLMTSRSMLSSKTTFHVIMKIQLLIKVSIEERLSTECKDASMKPIHVRGHFRMVGDRKVYVRAHYRKR